MPRIKSNSHQNDTRHPRKQVTVQHSNLIKGTFVDSDVLIKDHQLNSMYQSPTLHELNTTYSVQDTSTRTASAQDAASLKIKGTVYREISGGPVLLTHGSIVEGSVHYGGIQPHYVMDFKDPVLKPFLDDAVALRSIENETLRCREVCKILKRAIKISGYTDRRYKNLLSVLVAKQENVRMGQYIEVQKGVCREHGILAHLLLQTAGLESRYLYMKVCNAKGVIEDHGFAVWFDSQSLHQLHKGNYSQANIVDLYNSTFHDKKLKEFLCHQSFVALKKHELPANITRENFTTLPSKRSFYLKFIDYPRVWSPIHISPKVDIPFDFNNVDPQSIRIVQSTSQKIR